MQAFNTYKYVKQLQEAGFNERQAEVFVHSILESKNNDLSHLVTKEQVGDLKEEIDARYNELREQIIGVNTRITIFENKVKERFTHIDERFDYLEQSTKRQIAAAVSTLQTTAVKWLVSTVIGVTGVFVTILKFWF